MPELIGADVLFRKWAPPSPEAPRAVFLLVHGLGAHSARWEFLAGALAEAGFASYAIELRGFGRTPDRPRGHVDSFRLWDDDILALGDVVGKEHPGARVFLLGESLGGLVAFNLAALHPEPFAGLVLLAPAFKNAMKFPASAYAKLALLLLVRPKLMIDVPFTSEMVTSDPAYLAVMNASPDEVRQASLKLLGGCLPEQSRAMRKGPGLGVPVLVLLAGRDLLVDTRAARKAFDRVALTDKTLVEYPGMLHGLSIEAGRDRVFRDIIHWAGARL